MRRPTSISASAVATTSPCGTTAAPMHGVVGVYTEVAPAERLSLHLDLGERSERDARERREPRRRRPARGARRDAALAHPQRPRRQAGQGHARGGLERAPDEPLRRGLVELGDRYEAPVQGADDHEDAGEHVELLHVPLLPVEVSSRNGTDPGQMLSNICPTCVRCVHGERRAPPHRRAEPPNRRQARPSPRLGEAVRSACPAEDERGVPALPAHGRRDGSRRCRAIWPAGYPQPRPPGSRRSRTSPARPVARSPRSSDDFRAALDAYDEPLAQLLLDRMLAAFTLETVLRDALLPYLHELGDRWERGDASVAQEHFASSVIRGRLLGLARGWGSGSGPLAVLACPPGRSTISVCSPWGSCFAPGAGEWPISARIRLWRRSPTPPGAWAPTGSSCPRSRKPACRPWRRRSLALSATSGSRWGVAGGTSALAERTGAELLSGGPVEEAERLAGDRR